MNRLIPLLSLFSILVSCIPQKADDGLSAAINQAEENLRYQVEKISETVSDEVIHSKTIDRDKAMMVSPIDRADYFFSGELWMMYDLTGSLYWQEKALAFTSALEQKRRSHETPMFGLKMFCGFQGAWKNTGQTKYRDILLQSARILTSRFKPSVGSIQSFCEGGDSLDFPVKIEEMMNLELLFWAAENTGNQLFKKVAVEHAGNTLKNHFGESPFLFQCVDYNPQTGRVQNKFLYTGHRGSNRLCQGLSLALYGFTMVYRETGDDKFLRKAEKIADYIFYNSNLFGDLIRYRYLNGPDISNEPKDATSAAIISSALFELSSFSDNGEYYLKKANEIQSNLLNEAFFSNSGDKTGFVLKHSAACRPVESEVDVPLIYAEYYLIESILRKMKIKEN